MPLAQPDVSGDYITAGRLLRSAASGPLTRQELRAQWPTRRNASLTAARTAAENWYESADDRLHDPEWDRALRGNLQEIATSLATGQPLPFRMRFFVYEQAARDHFAGLAGLAIAAVVLVTVIYVIARSV